MGKRHVLNSRIGGAGPCGLSAWFWPNSKTVACFRLVLELVIDMSLKCFQNSLRKVMRMF